MYIYLGSMLVEMSLLLLECLLAKVAENAAAVLPPSEHDGISVYVLSLNGEESCTIHERLPSPDRHQKNLIAFFFSALPNPSESIMKAVHNFLTYQTDKQTDGRTDCVTLHNLRGRAFCGGDQREECGKNRVWHSCAIYVKLLRAFADPLRPSNAFPY